MPKPTVRLSLRDTTDFYRISRRLGAITLCAWRLMKLRVTLTTLENGRRVYWCPAVDEVMVVEELAP